MKRWLLLAILLAMVLSACSSATSNTTPGHKSKMAPVSQMPSAVQKAPTRVHEAYRFAVANPDLMKQIPCYSGCGAIGHTSNYACYVKEVKPDGSVNFDDHALGCSLCVDITQDARRMLDEGKSAQDIRAAIVANYSQFGPPNQ
jgi:hypothetical protein